MASLLHSSLVLAALCACAAAFCSSDSKGVSCGTPKVVKDVVPPGQIFKDVNLQVKASEAGCMYTYSRVEVTACEPGTRRPRVAIMPDLRTAYVTLSTLYQTPVPIYLNFHCDCTTE